MRQRKPVQRYLALTLCLLLLAGCGAGTPNPEASDVPGELAGTELGVGQAADDLFSLSYSSASSMNPYVTENTDNLLVTQLVYDNVFELDDAYNLSSRILTGWSSSDGQYWNFTVDTSLPMHDGGTLTAADVAYSIQLAMRTPRYAGRFSSTYGASAVSEDTVAVSLAAPNRQFPLLLTIPVVKYGSYGENRPVGSGPYKYVPEEDYLDAFEAYVGSEKLPVDRVYLREYTQTEAFITAFEDSYLDLVVNDPSGRSNLGYGGNTETRYFTTTNLHYLGVNMKSEFLRYVNIRYALQLAVDRENAAKTLMLGGAVASALPVSPKSPLYNESLAAGVAYDMETCIRVLNNANVRDFDEDGKLEYLEASIALEIDVDLIVCSESAGKGDIAKKFADDLREYGLTVSVRELGWDDYVAALEEGDFDLYYGEVKLSADFNLSSLLTEDGRMNYGEIEDPAYAQYIAEYLAADDVDRAERCDAMLSYIINTTPIIPICFERQEVITHRNVISGISPTSSNVFFGMTGWRITFE